MAAAGNISLELVHPRLFDVACDMSLADDISRHSQRDAGRLSFDRRFAPSAHSEAVAAETGKRNVAVHSLLVVPQVQTVVRECVVGFRAQEVFDLETNGEAVGRSAGPDQGIDHLVRSFKILVRQQRGDKEPVAVIAESALALPVGRKQICRTQVEASEIADRVVVFGPVQARDRDRSRMPELAPIKVVDRIVDPLDQHLALFHARLRIRRRHLVLAQDPQRAKPDWTGAHDRRMVREVGKDDPGGAEFRAVATSAVRFEQRPDFALERILKALVRGRCGESNRETQEQTAMQQTCHCKTLRLLGIGIPVDQPAGGRAFLHGADPSSARIRRPLWRLAQRAFRYS